MTGKRYGTVPDEVVQYAVGHYGQTVAPIEPDTLDRIIASPRQKVVDHLPEQPSLDDLKKNYGTDDDDELILRAPVPQANTDAMRAAGPVKRRYPLLSTRELEQMRELMKLTRLPMIEFISSTTNVQLRRQARPPVSQK